jgi:hypothetical protein
MSAETCFRDGVIKLESIPGFLHVSSFHVCKSHCFKVKVRDKGKFVPVLLAEHHAMKAYWGSGGIAPFIL